MTTPADELAEVRALLRASPAIMTIIGAGLTPAQDKALASVIAGCIALMTTPASDTGSGKP